MREACRDKGRLEHIMEAIMRIEEFTANMTEDSLKANILVKHATAYNIQIIGEAVYKLSPSFKKSHPDTPWQNIEKMRHILVHDYYQVNEHIMWLVISEDITPLKQQIQKYISEF